MPRVSTLYVVQTREGQPLDGPFATRADADASLVYYRAKYGPNVNAEVASYVAGLPHEED